MALALKLRDREVGEDLGRKRENDPFWLERIGRIFPNYCKLEIGEIMKYI